MKREARLPNLFAAAFENVGIHRPGGAKVSGINRAVLLQHLGELHNYFIARIAINFQPDPA